MLADCTMGNPNEPSQKQLVPGSSHWRHVGPTTEDPAEEPPLSTSARAVAGMRKIWPGAVVARGAEPSGAERSGWVKNPPGLMRMKEIPQRLEASWKPRFQSSIIFMQSFGWSGAPGFWMVETVWPKLVDWTNTAKSSKKAPRPAVSQSAMGQNLGHTLAQGVDWSLPFNFGSLHDIIWSLAVEPGKRRLGRATVFDQWIRDKLCRCCAK